MRDRLIKLIASKICSRYRKDTCLTKWSSGCGECEGPWNFEIGDFADYLLAEGVIVPPCKVNDNVWLVYTPRWPADPADNGKWFMIEDGVQRIIYGAKGLSIETWNMGTIPEKDIGKKLFFTKDDAEKALAEKENGR